MSIAAPDPVSSVLHSALDGLALRQRVIADNIANVDTPEFRATSVDFESSLRSAILDGSVANGRITPTTAPTGLSNPPSTAATLRRAPTPGSSGSAATSPSRC